ncbi:MAG TPA: class I SAM-dependent methyltransferase [Anaerolineales bacterium]|nr:class I SAM-dependent methyltransferase [Anaerolineales bacterium]
MTPADRFPAADFDDWAETYDDSVSADRFPFYGYQETLEKAVALAAVRPGMRVLDLGAGTGNLSMQFAKEGCELCCTDFSEAMLARARQKLPAARFLLHDLRAALPPEFEGPFDRIVSAYVFHHFELDEKLHILQSLREHLAPGGQMVIADIAFPGPVAIERMKASMGADWEEEFYWIAEAAIPALEKAGFKVEYLQVSACAGIFLIRG